MTASNPEPNEVRVEFVVRMGSELFEIGSTTVLEGTWRQDLPQALRAIADDLDYELGAER